MTAHILRITDGTTTKTLTDGTTMELGPYEMQVSTNGENITERLRVNFISTTPATNVANIQSLNKLFEQARNYAQTQTGAKVYLEIDEATTSVFYRSMLFDGRVILNDRVLAPYQYDQIMMLEVEWTRQPFWEGELTQIPLTNSSDTDNTAGITVTNANDATAENWVSIDGANDMAGDLPAPIKLQMYNSKSGADATNEIMVFHNVYSTPATFAHILEGEDGTQSDSTFTDTGDAACSSDFYTAIAWAATTETALGYWALDGTTVLDAGAGGRFAIVARWFGAFPYDDMWLRLRLQSGAFVLWNGDLKIVPDTRELRILDIARIPPYLPGQSSLVAINLWLRGFRNQSGTHTINLDYLMLAPIAGDNSWLHVKAKTNGVAYQEYFVRDEIEDETYKIDTGAELLGEFSDKGGEIMLVPGETQYLYFMTCDYNGAAKVDQTWTIKLWYRPRRNSL